MKVYVHLEEYPEYTHVYHTNANVTVEDLTQVFVSAYNAKFGTIRTLLPAQLTISNERKKTLTPPSLVEKIAKDKEDLYVKLTPTKVTTTVHAPSAPTLPPVTPSIPAPSTPSITPVTTPTIPPPAEDVASVASILKEIQLKTANNAKSRSLEEFPSGVQGWVKESLQIADKSAEQGNFRHAISIHEQVLAIIPNHPLSLLRLGELYLAAGRINLAIEYFTKGSKTNPDIHYEIGLGDSFYQKGEPMEATKYYMRALRLLENSSNLELQSKVQVLIAKALYKSGGQTERETAIQILTTILRTNEEHVEALHQYGVVMRDLGKVPDALRIFLKILVLSPNNKYIKENIADVLQGEGGMAALSNELHSQPSSAPAYAYLATFIKDYGAVEESVSLYKTSLEMRPTSASYCLNLVHTVEITGRYHEAFDVIKTFCKQNETLNVGGNVTCAQIYRAIERVHDLQEHTNSLWVPPTTQQITKFDIPPQKGTTPDPSLIPYTPDELDLLALFATIVKIAYVVGGLDIIPDIIKLLEPAREGRELHLTSVRNELAYYSCIAQIMLTQTLPLVNYRKIYVIGDSHSLSPGWRTITVQGEKTLLQPALVTGLKIWHLRPESKFFPKANFYNVIRRIPKGATIILIFGEIDCREGLLLAVEKCRYKDLDEAMTVTIEIYMTVIRQLLADYNFTIYIHPPPPVLDPTRKLVKKFTKILQARVEKEPRLSWLNIFDSLLTPDSEDLNPTYKFDGTHLNPSYVDLLETALNTQ